MIPLVLAFGCPAAILGLLAGLAVEWSTGVVVISVVVAIALTIALSGGMAIAVSREADAPNRVAAAGVVLGLMSGAGFLAWLAVGLMGDA